MLEVGSKMAKSAAIMEANSAGLSWHAPGLQMGVGRERLRLGHLDFRGDECGRSAIIGGGLGKITARAAARGE